MIAKRHIPNALTLLRYALIPAFLASWYLPAPYGLWLPLGIALLACITDFFDGYLARRWSVESDLGRLLDPNADKALICAALAMLAFKGYASPLAVSLILCRELLVSGLREFMAERQMVVRVSQLAKWKTAAQMVAILILLYGHGCGCSATHGLGQWTLWAAAALTALTGYQYFRGALQHILKKVD